MILLTLKEWIEVFIIFIDSIRLQLRKALLHEYREEITVEKGKNKQDGRNFEMWSNKKPPKGYEA